MAPATTYPRLIAISETVGSIALGSAWLRRIRVSVMPFARAVVMYSSDMVSMIDERIRIEYWPMSPRATVATGRTRWADRSARYASGESWANPSVVLPKRGTQVQGDGE